jgi:hypothetical protein
MDGAYRDLGQRIVEAARLAVALHLKQEAEQSRRIAADGVGGGFPTDGSSSRSGVRFIRPLAAEGEAA